MTAAISDQVANGAIRTDAAKALLAQGFDGERLLRLARSVANNEINRRGSVLGDKREDLVGFLVLNACRKAPDYDASRSGPGYTFASWLYDSMEHWADDFYRRKSEGFGDRRYGNDNRILLHEDPDPADHDTDFEELVSDRRRARWQQAADLVGWPLSEWIVISLDKAARQVGRTAA